MTASTRREPYANRVGAGADDDDDDDGSEARFAMARVNRLLWLPVVTTMAAAAVLGMGTRAKVGYLVRFSRGLFEVRL